MMSYDIFINPTKELCLFGNSLTEPVSKAAKKWDPSKVGNKKRESGTKKVLDRKKRMEEMAQKAKRVGFPGK